MLRQNPHGLTLAIRAQPGAKRTSITGIYGDGDNAQLKIAVHAPPLEGRANAALIEFLAETFALPKSAIELISGDSSRSKLFQIRGITLAQVNIILARHLRN